MLEKFYMTIIHKSSDDTLYKLKNDRNMCTKENLYKISPVRKYHIILIQNIIFRLREAAVECFLLEMS